MKKVLLVMRIDGGAYLSIPMDEKQAKNFLTGWRTGQMSGMLHGDENGGWAIRVDKIVLMHLQPIEGVVQTGQNPIGSPYKSGGY